MDAGQLEWGLLTFVVAFAVGTGLGALGYHLVVEEARRSRVQMIVAGLSGGLIAIVAMVIVQALNQFFAGWDWVHAVLLGIGIAAGYVFLTWRTRPAYARPPTSALITLLSGALIAVLILAATRWSGWRVPNQDWIAVATLGALVGLSELVSRYRDSPTRTIITVPGILYLALNAAAAAAAFALAPALGFSGQAAIPPGDDTIHWVPVLAAGLGAMTLLRSSVIVVRSGDQDLRVGPNALLQSLIDAVDRSLQRQEAQERAWTVARVMEKLLLPNARPSALPRHPLQTRAATSPAANNHASRSVADREAQKRMVESALIMIPDYCLRLQRISEQDRQRLSTGVNELKTKEGLSDRVRLLGVALLTLDVVGAGVLQAAVDSLADDIRTAAEQSAKDTARASAKARRTVEATEEVKHRTARAAEAARAPGVPEAVTREADQADRSATAAVESARVTAEEMSVAEEAAQEVHRLVELQAPQVPEILRPSDADALNPPENSPPHEPESSASPDDRPANTRGDTLPDHP